MEEDKRTMWRLKEGERSTPTHWIVTWRIKWESPRWATGPTEVHVSEGNVHLDVTSKHTRNLKGDRIICWKEKLICILIKQLHRGASAVMDGAAVKRRGCPAGAQGSAALIRVVTSDRGGTQCQHTSVRSKTAEERGDSHSSNLPKTQRTRDCSIGEYPTNLSVCIDHITEHWT